MRGMCYCRAVRCCQLVTPSSGTASAPPSFGVDTSACLRHVSEAQRV